MFRVLSVCVLLLVTSCNLVSSIKRENLRNDNNDNTESIDSQQEKLSQEENPDCMKRALNPPEQPVLSESELDILLSNQFYLRVN